MPSPSRLSSLSAPTNVSGAPFGLDIKAFQDSLLNKGGIALYVARDDKTAATALKLAEFFHPTTDRVLLPGWDMLPYDRVSPSAAVASQRCAALARIVAEVLETP